MKRIVAFALAVVLAIVLMDTVIPDICASLTPDNWFLWWWHGCGGPSSGGGGGGAG